jgi:hypothetical protein
MQPAPLPTRERRRAGRSSSMCTRPSRRRRRTRYARPAAEGNFVREGLGFAAPPLLRCAARHHGGGAIVRIRDCWQRPRPPVGVCGGPPRGADACWKGQGKGQQMGSGLRNVRFAAAHAVASAPRRSAGQAAVRVPLKPALPLLRARRSLAGSGYRGRQRSGCRGSHYSDCAWYCCHGLRWAGPALEPCRRFNGHAGRIATAKAPRMLAHGAALSTHGYPWGTMVAYSAILGRAAAGSAAQGH